VPCGVRVEQASGPVRSAFSIPDLASVAAAVTLFYCLFLFQGHTKLFRDSDSGWHIRTGESILATGALPRTDPYSFTRGGQPWFAWEWGADVLMGAAHRAAGLGGVAMLYGLAIAAGVWLWFRLTWAAGGDFFLAAAMSPLLLSTCNIHWMARPHVLSWVFLLLAVWYAETRTGPPGIRSLAAIALFTAAWANIHASFFLAPVIALIYAAGCFLRPLVWDLDRRAEWGRARGFALAAAAAAAGSLLNPYGWNLHRHLFAYLTDTELLKRVGEFQSFNFHAEGAGQIVATLLLVVVGGTAALARQRPDWFLLSLLLAAAALRSARVLPLVALAGLPLANGAIAGVLREAPLRLPLKRIFAYSARLRKLDARAGGLGWAALAALAMCLLLRVPAIAAATGFPPDQFPVAASAYLAELPHNARLLAPDKFGGYLIYRFAGRRKVFFDGRSDLYGAAFLARYARLVQVRPGWQREMAAFGFTHALLPKDYSLAGVLEAAGWKRLYRDGTAVLLEGPQK
jgi:hypothetical protein